MTTAEFIRLHQDDDISATALLARRYPDVDVSFALRQIEGLRKAKVKLPSWAGREGVIFPSVLSMEQCSSETTAHYKAELVARLLPAECRNSMTDLTGGFGVDFSFLAPLFRHAVFVECQGDLCDIMAHNAPLLSLEGVDIVCADCEGYITAMPQADMVFIDPARRDNNGGRVYGIADCTPDLTRLLPLLMSKTRLLIAKLSPMLDITATISAINAASSARVTEVHVVAVHNECKELLVVVDSKATDTLSPMLYCVNDDDVVSYRHGNTIPPITLCTDLSACHYLMEPNAALMKAGCFPLLCSRYNVAAVGTNSHLFVSSGMPDNFPGRVFHIYGISSLNRKSVKPLLPPDGRANISTRNFPLTPNQLSKRLHLADGGETYIFATTNIQKENILFFCTK
ncbi:MAG: SAM-dependent methyltransferase [Prevotella sp.]|nr:SAM-dependent methyltransferase [Prevotella sp.]